MKLSNAIYWLGAFLAFPLIFLFFAAFFDLLHSTIFMTERVLKWDAASIVGGFTAGIMTIFAGWLAFKEARRSNQDGNRVQTMNLLIEHMKAVNIVFDEITKVHKRACTIGLLSINNIPIIEATKNPALLSTDNITLAAQKIGEMIPRLIEINSPALANACVILPLEVPRMVCTVNDAIDDMQKSYKQVLPVGVAFSTDDLVWKNALYIIFMPTGNDPSKLDQLIKCTKEALSALDKMRVKYSDDYAKIIAHYMSTPIKPLNKEAKEANKQVEERSKP